MKRMVIALMVAILMLLMVVPVASAGGRAEVIRGQWDCWVGWTDGTNETEASCQVVNVRTGSGGYVLTLRGQLDADQISAWQQDGAPRQYDTGGACLANWRFVVEYDEEMALTESVRRFTPSGKVIEVCHFRLPRDESA
jgi:hypothetical protein